MILNLIGALAFGYFLIKTDYTTKAKWMYYMDGLFFAVNFALVLTHITNMIEV